MNERKNIEDFVVDTIDYTGARVIFTKKKWEQKSKQHPELKSKKFIENLPKALKKPQIVWQDYDEPKKKICCYWKYSITDYIKVVVWIFGNPRQIVSAFQVNYIKEEKYSSKLKRLV